MKIKVKFFEDGTDRMIKRKHRITAPNLNFEIILNSITVFNPYSDYYVHLGNNKGAKTNSNLNRVGYIGGKKINDNPGEAQIVYSLTGSCCTIKRKGGGQGRPCGLYHFGDYIRPLIPIECWWLMGFTSKDYETALDKLKEIKLRSNRFDKTLHDMAGNSIPVPVLEGIFTSLFPELIG